jgi:DNA polymerase-4
VTHRKIIHVDMDAFYASVEQRDRPHLGGRPVVVGGDGERGVVAAASYEARRHGIRSAMPMRTAKRLCADLVVVPADFGRYRQVSRQLHDILDRATELVEPLSLDECYLDVTHNLLDLPSATDVAKWIRRQVAEDLGLTCSAGVAPLKFVAKIASDENKPDGLTVVPPGRVLAYIRPLRIERLWGVGPATGARLRDRGLTTVGELGDLGEVEALALLGRKGLFLWRMANGEDPRPVRPHRRRKSLGAEETFAEDRLDVESLAATIAAQARALILRLARGGLGARTVTLKLRYDDFETITRSQTLQAPTRDPALAVEVAITLLRDRTEAGARPVRLAGVSLGNLVGAPDEEAGQLPLPFAELD